MLLFGCLSVLLAASWAYQVQEDEVKFTLYNKNVPNGLMLNKTNLCNINPNHHINFLVHGRGSSALPSWIPEVTDTYLQIGDYNIIQVDWSQLSGQPDDSGRAKVADAAYFAAQLVRRIHKRLAVPLKNFHLMGHSIGSHFVGFTGKHVKEALNAPVGRVTGLDPSNSDFSDLPVLENGLQKTDGSLVVAIHTDDTGVGSRGHIDFHANGGAHPQPGCDTNICSHMMSCEYFNEALQNLDGFLGTKCDSYESYVSGVCDGNNQVAFGGNLLGHEGDYYFLTNAEPPYSQS